MASAGGVLSSGGQMQFEIHVAAQRVRRRWRDEAKNSAWDFRISKSPGVIKNGWVVFLVMKAHSHLSVISHASVKKKVLCHLKCGKWHRKFY